MISFIERDNGLKALKKYDGKTKLLSLEDNIVAIYIDVIELSDIISVNTNLFKVGKGLA